jgi:hypothetical protein
MGGAMMAARDEARARIAARMEQEARRGAPVAHRAAQGLAWASARVLPGGTLAEERALRPDGGDFAACGARLRGADPDAETFLDRAVRRLAARQRALEMSAPHRTPRPGEGRAT